MAYEDIYQKYKALQDAASNQYTDVVNNLNNKATATKNQYAQMYNQLDQQNQQAKDQNYTDRNNVDVGVNQNLNRIQELMAKNGWLGGGENLQAQMQSNSDRMNGFGNADKARDTLLNNILNSRNKYNSEEQLALNDINNQISSADREKANKIQQIIASQQSEISQRQQQEAQVAAQLAAQRAAAAQKASKSSASSGSGITTSDIDQLLNGTYSVASKKQAIYGLINELQNSNTENSKLLKNYAANALRQLQGQTDDNGSGGGRRISGNSVY